MSYRNNNNNFEFDPVSSESRPWYSSTSSPARYDEGLYDYCLYCIQNFRKMYSMVNNVCSSCGRVADPVFKNKQENIAVTSVNAPLDMNELKGVSMEFDYSPLNTDPTTGLFTDNQTRMTAKSAGEAMKKIRTVEEQNTIVARAAQMRGEKFIQKTTASKDDNKLLFDNNI